MRSADPVPPSGDSTPAQSAATPAEPEVKRGPGGVLTRRATNVDDAEEHGKDSHGKSARASRRRPCFHCGAMTSVKVLEKTGDLCWNCYRPAGSNAIKLLIAVAVVLLVAGGGWLGWKQWVNRNGAAADNAVETTTGKQFSAEEKVAILKRHLLDGVTVANLCRTYGMQPAEYQQWQQMFVESGERAFEPVVPREPGTVERRITTIEQKIQMAAKVLTELRENISQLRKESGHYEGSPAQKYILDSAGAPPREK